jgi:hypothetical protein
VVDLHYLPRIDNHAKRPMTTIIYRYKYELLIEDRYHLFLVLRPGFDSLRCEDVHLTVNKRLPTCSKRVVFARRPRRWRVKREAVEEASKAGGEWDAVEETSKMAGGRPIMVGL